MRFISSLVLAFTLIQFSTPAFAKAAFKEAVEVEESMNLKDAIQAREDVWSAAYNANDAAALGAIYEEDAVLIPPGSPPVHGRAAISEALSGLFPILKDLKLVTDDVRPIGEDYAIEIGSANYNALGEDGSLTPVTDDYVVVWHKGEDGVWYYMNDMFNSR